VQKVHARNRIEIGDALKFYSFGREWGDAREMLTFGVDSRLSSQIQVELSKLFDPIP
jgi:hypothetical protein